MNHDPQPPYDDPQPPYDYPQNDIETLDDIETLECESRAIKLKSLFPGGVPSHLKGCETIEDWIKKTESLVGVIGAKFNKLDAVTSNKIKEALASVVLKIPQDKQEYKFSSKLVDAFKENKEAAAVAEQCIRDLLYGFKTPTDNTQDVVNMLDKLNEHLYSEQIEKKNEAAYARSEKLYGKSALDNMMKKIEEGLNKNEALKKTGASARDLLNRLVNRGVAYEPDLIATLYAMVEQQGDATAAKANLLERIEGKGAVVAGRGGSATTTNVALVDMSNEEEVGYYLLQESRYPNDPKVRYVRQQLDLQRQKQMRKRNNNSMW